MISRNKNSFRIFNNFITIICLLLSIYIIIHSFVKKDKGVLLQERLRKSYDGLSPQDYDYE